MSIVGTIQRHADFQSRFVAARNVDVWLPPDYADDKRYPVLYMHDGQNIFEPISSIGGVAWEIDRALTQLADAKKIPNVIVVGVWNSDLRWREYMPQKVCEAPVFEQNRGAFLERAGGPSISDSYLRFLVEEVKPFVDANYPTLPGQRNTFVMGSSMGGLISLYAISQYPQVFFGAACVSTHWSAGLDVLVDELAKMLPDPGTHRLYFDYGTAGVDAPYEPFQLQMDGYLRAAGYTESNWLTLKFEGADHNEAAWRVRVKIPLEFLLGS